MPKEMTDAQKQKMEEGRAIRTRKDREARIEEILSRPGAEKCRCGITPQWTDEQLRNKCVKSCSPGWVCSTLDTVMRNVYNYHV